MDFKDLIRKGFDEYLDDLKGHLEGLTEDERRFQIAPESNHIDFIVWHMARVEDDFLQRFAQRAPTVWQRDGWHERLGLPERASGFRYTPKQVAELPRFDMGEMLAYYDAVRAETYKFLDSISESDLANKPHPRRPQYSVCDMFSHLMCEESQHVGQVAYIRGIQRGIEAAG